MRVKMWANDDFTVHGNLIKICPINIAREPPRRTQRKEYTQKRPVILNSINLLLWGKVMYK